jgi:tetratricopeptide (TPR) repeat protein
LGVAQSNLQKTLPAIRTLQKALELQPGNIRVQSLLGLQFVEGSYYQEAIRFLSRAVELNPAEPTLRFLLIQAHYKNQDSVKALQLAEEALKRFPKLAQSYYELGFQYGSMGRFREAKPYLQDALRLNPDYAEAHTSLGDLLLREDKAEEALLHFRQALKANSSSDAYVGLGKALLALNRPEAVIAEMEKVVGLFPMEPQLHYSLAQAYRALGQQEKTQVELETFNQLNKERMKRKDQEVSRKFPSP